MTTVLIAGALGLAALVALLALGLCRAAAQSDQMAVREEMRERLFADYAAVVAGRTDFDAELRALVGGQS